MQIQDEKDKERQRLNEFAADVHENAVKHGFWEPEPSFPEVIALIHSEASEALEEYRKGKEPNEISMVGNKPEGIPYELADIILRVLDYCGAAGIDIETFLENKHAFNKSRPYKHGKKI